VCSERGVGIFGAAWAGDWVVKGVGAGKEVVKSMVASAIDRG